MQYNLMNLPRKINVKPKTQVMTYSTKIITYIIITKRTPPPKKKKSLRYWTCNSSLKYNDSSDVVRTKLSNGGRVS